MEEQYEESLLWIRFAQMIGAEATPEDGVWAIRFHKEIYWSDEIHEMRELLFEVLIPFMESQGFPVWYVRKTQMSGGDKPFLVGFQEEITPNTTDEKHLVATGCGDSIILAAIAAAVKALRRKEEREALGSEEKTQTP